MRNASVYFGVGPVLNATAVTIGETKRAKNKAKRPLVSPEVCQQVAQALRARECKWRVRDRFKISRTSLDFVEGEMMLGRYGGWGSP